MARTLADDLFSQLQGLPMQQMAQQLGADPAQLSQAVGAALPMMLGALGRNAQEPAGAQALFGALQRDHATATPAAGMPDMGGLLGSVLGGVFGGGGQVASPPSRQLDAGGILGHIFGGAQPRAEAGLGQASGLSSGQAGQLLKMLAPLVMAFLASRVRAGQLDAGGLGNVLGQERTRVQQQGGLAGGLLTSVLDQNGDGQLDMGDLVKLGGSLLGGRR
ncbi:MAG: DUF937 domain-containing protein [Comamonadaceae bacterium]|nr:DUF937 domain-containing protein [Comamonadaceae bacterium]